MLFRSPGCGVCFFLFFVFFAGCRQRLFENLRMLPHAPGVQMQPIPEDAVQEDSGDEDEEDPDKRISSRCLVASIGCLA